MSSVFMKMRISFSSDYNFGDMREYSSINFLTAYFPNLTMGFCFNR